MSMRFIDLQDEVLRRATKNQSGGNFTTAVKNIINTSIQRIAFEANWRILRRKSKFSTVPQYTTGTGTLSATNNSNSFSGTGLLLITNGIQVGRRIQIEGSTQRYIIETITGENTFTTNLPYDGTTAVGTLDFTIFGQEEYNLPIQLGKSAILWHEDYGYPFSMEYISDTDFYQTGTAIENGNTPVWFRMWGSDQAIVQPLEPSVVTVASTDSADTNITTTVFGTVGGFPDFESIITNSIDGTTSVSGTKLFQTVERVVKDSTTNVGRINFTANSGNRTIATLPVGTATFDVNYWKVQIWPLPLRTFDINVQYYKAPWYLVNDNDIHELGQRFDEAIILLATAKVNAEENKQEADRFMAYYVDEINLLKRTELDIIPNWQPHLRRALGPRFFTAGLIQRNLSFQQLGGNFGPASFF